MVERLEVVLSDISRDFWDTVECEADPEEVVRMILDLPPERVKRSEMIIPVIKFQIMEAEVAGREFRLIGRYEYRDPSSVAARDPDVFHVRSIQPL